MVTFGCFSQHSIMILISVETYLEQKSGFRILWTEEGNNIVIWFVAKHKEVSRLMKLIDDSKSRSARQQLPASLVSELQNDYLLPQLASRKEVLLDVFGNTPMKIYDVNLTSIDEITRKEWTPKLHLTDEEREIVEGDGTVLVLGRSGTGKVSIDTVSEEQLSLLVCQLSRLPRPADCLHLQPHGV